MREGTDAGRVMQARCGRVGMWVLMLEGSDVVVMRQGSDVAVEWEGSCARAYECERPLMRMGSAV